MADNKKKLILATGVTGHQGGAVMQHLQQKGFPVRAATRNPQDPKVRGLVGHGTEVVRADLGDPESLAQAVDGVYGVFSVQTAENVENEVKQGINLAEAARRARVSQLVYSSVASADKSTGIPHFDSKFQIEEHVRQTGVPYSIVRPVFFMDNLLGMKQAIEGGTLAFPLSPDKRLQMIAVDDIGGIATLAFEHPGKWQGRALDIAGDELSMEELATAFTRITGREVRYQQVPWEEFEKKMGKEMAVMYRWFEDVGYDVNISALKEEYPRLTSFERWLQTSWRAAAATAG